MIVHVVYAFLLILQFILLRGEWIKSTYVKLRNKWCKPWFIRDETVIYNGANYQVVFMFDSDWEYKYYLCKIDPSTHFGKCETVVQSKLKRKSTLEKLLE